MLKPSIAGRKSNTSSRRWPRRADHAEGIKRDQNQDGARTSHSFQAGLPTRARRPPQVEQARFAHVHRPARFPIYFLSPPQLFLFFFFSSPSQCRGFTCISEDSSEITFLLVENYNLTALDQLRKDWLRNFWSPSQSRSSSIDFHSFIANTPTGSVVKKVCPLAISLRATPLARPPGLCRPKVLPALGVCSVGAATVTSRILVLVACSTCAPRHFATQSRRHHQHIHGPTDASMKRV